MKKIALIIPYIGKFHSDIIFWIKSVEKNPTIDFLLFTDAKLEHIPQNLHIYKTSFLELQKMFQANFDFKICLKKPYKFCDFRPCYGEVFADYLKDYDFWGYTDTDMVYGNIRKYITDDLLDNYDKIFGLGHFSLYRNTLKVNSIYKLVTTPNYKQVFTFGEGCAFDEYYGISAFWDQNLKNKFYMAYPFDDIDCMDFSFKSQMKRAEYIGCEDTIYAYDNGTLFRIFIKHGKVCKEESMYVHFQKREMKVNVGLSDRFMMIPNAYIPYVENLTVTKLHQLGHRISFYPHYYKLQWGRIKNKLRKMFTKEKSEEFGIPQLPSDSFKYYIE